MSATKPPRLWPITPRNSTVLGHDATTPAWRKWWTDVALWDEAVPNGGGGCWGALHVPCRDSDGAVYRVRARREGPSCAVRGPDGGWCWVYGPKDATLGLTAAGTFCWVDSDGSEIKPPDIARTVPPKRTGGDPC